MKQNLHQYQIDFITANLDLLPCSTISEIEESIDFVNKMELSLHKNYNVCNKLQKILIKKTMVLKSLRTVILRNFETQAIVKDMNKANTRVINFLWLVALSFVAFSVAIIYCKFWLK